MSRLLSKEALPEPLGAALEEPLACSRLGSLGSSGAPGMREERAGGREEAEGVGEAGGAEGEDRGRPPSREAAGGAGGGCRGGSAVETAGAPHSEAAGALGGAVTAGRGVVAGATGGVQAAAGPGVGGGAAGTVGTGTGMAAGEAVLAEGEVMLCPHLGQGPVTPAKCADTVRWA